MVLHENKEGSYMHISKNKLAAITGAIGLYLAAEEQVVSFAPQEQRAPEAPRPTFSPWVMSGRQSMMEMRQLFQKRLFR
jgi:hypothetical protein